jgi:signal transduction histidine kinase
VELAPLPRDHDTGRAAADSVADLLLPEPFLDRAAILLQATNAFLVCDDFEALGRAIDGAMRNLFAPDKSSVTLVGVDGRIRLVAADGYTADELANIQGSLAGDSRLVRSLLHGEEMWSADPERDAFRERISQFGARAGFALPIVTPSGVSGTCSAIYRDERGFDDAFRTAARSLVAQAGLTVSLLASRDAARRSAEELAAQRDLLAVEVDERTRSLRTALDELRVASDAKTDFLANVSHELRTPLTAILGFAEVLATGLDGPLNEGQTRDLTTIQSSSRHLLQLIDNLIDIASIEAGRLELAIEAVPVAPLLHACADTLRPLAAARGIRLEVLADGALDDDDRVAADPGRLREIVLNLLSNAVKFTAPGGGVEVGLAFDPDAARIIVRDSGIGIAAENHDRIFEKFSRVADPSIPGTGLGLAIARELARLQRGDVSVQSVVGEGSTFVVRLPRAGIVSEALAS